MKCPVCNVLLDECGDLLYCPNDHCAWVGNKELWQELIRTKKQLEIAVEELEDLANAEVLADEWVWMKREQAKEALKAIQKDVK